MKTRIMIVFTVLIAMWASLVLRAAYLQIIPSEKLKALHERQFRTVITLQNRRGAIVDRQGRELALSTAAYSLYADPKIIENRKSVARKLAKELNMSVDVLWSKLKHSEKRFVWITRQLDKEKADRIRAWDERGLAFVEEYRRVYPNESLLSQSLGFIGREGAGLEGIEMAYNHDLEGDKKKVQVRRDARGRPLIADGMMFAENPDGAEIKLTVDSELQHFLEKELAAATAEFEADQAFGVVLDAKTSAVISLAAFPTYDPNAPAHAKTEWRKNRAMTDAFEPGSTMKTFAIAGALRNNIAQPNTRYSTENGSLRIGDRVIHEAELDHHWPSLTVSEILAFSSNIGTTKIAFQLGDDRLREVLYDFGFGRRTGIDLPGEAKGTLQDLPWNQHLLSNISFGHGVAATPLQMANAYAAIANGGMLNTPYMIQSIRNPETGVVTETKPKPVRRVLSAEQAASLRMMLLGVTNPGGTGVNARVDGFMVSGKTGTAQKVNPNGRGYLPKGYISSFAGFIPTNDPKFVIYVAVDHPRKNSFFGATVAAPVFSRIASYAVRKEGLAPILLSEKNIVPAPGYKVKEARQIVKGKGRFAKVSTTKTSNVHNVGTTTDRKLASTQNDFSGAPGASRTGGALQPEQSPMIRTSADLMQIKTRAPLSVMPNLHALTLREALQQLRGNDMQIKVLGHGTVVQTTPEAGASIEPGSEVHVILSNN